MIHGSDANHAAFAEWLKEYSQKYHVDVHAWVMMTNHVHLLCMPRKENGISQILRIIAGRAIGSMHWEMFLIYVPPHPEYLNLGGDSDKRRENYRELFKHHFSDTVLEQIRKATNKGMIVGNDRFREEIEALTGRRVKVKKRGRPVGWRKPKF
ncbi:transposase [Desulfobacter latus]|uniref:Transposase n=1 Tax=Desulfobacter latus TaxID=2292 RepID=A0A850SQQ8_9BACT|nr:transposase [Desulfobacter latus]NWH03784.1 transposase [Desulfobacter latus]